ncbi:hypothetical protein POM88_019409 [Heracleum sosnowskyi]|uniref:SWIM-type domain-containing protein n=1 Tax=Heracleum sosnowskyi TaxID=360622 RepID=A0AAD8IAV1_9APIA|nr:hypothetical protein POM88_019409 [Heracleum sosnowskyi]
MDKNRDIEESEQAWLKFKEKYKHSFEDPLTDKQKNELESWRWLENMYDQRKHWVRAYLQNTIFAGMKSSQRSENRRDKEEDQDFICMSTKPDLTKLTPIESHASQVYTKNVFNKFKEEFVCVFHCRHKKLKKDGDKSTYQVTYNYDDKVVSHVVNIISEFDFKCSCAHFETTGLLCKHILYLMKQKFDFTSIPEKYILPRWTLGARHSSCSKADKILEDSQKITGEHKVKVLQAWNFRTYMDRIFDRVVRRPEFLVAATNCLENLTEQLDIVEAKLEDTITVTEVGNQVTPMSHTSQITIRDPSKCKTKGRPKVAKGILSGKQASQVQTKSREKMFPETLNGTEDARVSVDESAEGLNFILRGKMDNTVK